jgi:hypothetical protein
MTPNSKRMPRVDQATLNRASRTWRDACRKLGVEVVAPFTVAEEGTSVACLAFLPDFGGPNGMVIGGMNLPEIVPDDTLQRLTKRKGLWLSFVNVSAFAGREVAEAVFKEALNDWGYFGPLENCPDWYGGYNHTQVGITHRELVRAWTGASRSLGIQVITVHPPFTGRCTFIALLPDFGSPAGMVLGATYPPGFDKDQSIEDFAKGAGMFCSFLNGPDYAVCDETKYKEVLLGWGYFGAPETRPVWLSHGRSSRS